VTQRNEKWSAKSLVALCLTCLALGSLGGVVMYSHAATSPEATPLLIGAPSIYGDAYWVAAVEVTNNMLGLFSDPITATTLDTGQGANELYDMDQNVLTTSDVQFNSVDSQEYFLNTVDITDSVPLKEASYIINTDGTTIWAINGATGATDFSGADAATVIQAAVDYLESLTPTGGGILIKRGSYVFTNSVNITKSNVYIRGEGMRNTIITLGNGVNKAIFRWVAVSHYYFGGLSDIGLDGNAANNVAGSGIELQYISDLQFNNIIIQNVNDHGIYIIGSGTAIGNTGTYNLWITNSLIEYSGKYGIYLDGSTKFIQRVWIVDNYFAENYFSAIYADGGSANYRVQWLEISRNKFTSDFRHGVELLGVRQFSIDDNQIWDESKLTVNTYSGIKLTSYCIKGSIINNIIENLYTGNMKYGLEIAATTVDYMRVSLNHFSGATSPSYIIAGALAHQSIVRSNTGYVTENGGTATLWNLTSSITISHGLSYTPTAGDISVTPITNLSNCTQYWFDTIGAANFVIHVGDAGAEKNTLANIEFAWRADRH